MSKGSSRKATSAPATRRTFSRLLVSPAVLALLRELAGIRSAGEGSR